ncbi:hypothetical protein ABSA28_00035 [Candidatus Hepatincolaceae symbiont of Richtersius coronifer]
MSSNSPSFSLSQYATIIKQTPNQTDNKVYLESMIQKIKANNKPLISAKKVK